MKYNIVKMINKIVYIILAVLLLLCLVVCFSSGFPILPTSQQINTDSAHLLGTISFFPVIFFCCFSIVVSVLILYFGVTLRGNVPEESSLSNACITFSGFVLVSGIWILTDSKVKFLFSDDTRAAVLISFIAFMLMPIIFLECFNFLYRLTPLQIMRWLFSANLTVFFILVLLKVRPEIYLYSLAAHHTLIFVLVFYCIIKYLKSFIPNRTRGRKHVPLGMIIFFLSVVLSIVMFLLEYTDMYAIALSVGLIALICSILRLMLNKLVDFFKEQMRAEFYMNMAYTDILSGLQNRNAFLKDQQTTAESSLLCYVVLDINNLKRINDQYGHNRGDSVIRTTADLIQNSFSEIGKCYRIGGDEFAVICTSQEEAIVKDALHHLDQSLDKHNSELNAEDRLSLAYGYAFRETPQTSIEQLFNNADNAMYLCKKAKKLHSSHS